MRERTRPREARSVTEFGMRLIDFQHQLGFASQQAGAKGVVNVVHRIAIVQTGAKMNGQCAPIHGFVDLRLFTEGWPCKRQQNHNPPHRVSILERSPRGRFRCSTSSEYGKVSRCSIAQCAVVDADIANSQAQANVMDWSKTSMMSSRIFAVVEDAPKQERFLVAMAGAFDMH